MTTISRSRVQAIWNRARPPQTISPMAATIGAGLAIAAVAMIVAISVRSGRDLQAAGVAVALFSVLVSLRWPLLPLFALAVLIPLEEVVVIGDLGTLSRYASLLFIVAYGVPRLGRLTLRAMPVAGYAFILWATFSAAWAIDAATSWSEIPALVLLLIAAVVVAQAIIDRPEIIRPLLWAYSLSAGATALLGVLTFVVSGGPVGPNDRIGGLAGQNPAYFAAILLPAAVFALDELLHGRWLAPSAAIVFLCTVAIAISGTRGAWLSLAVVVVVFILPRLDPLRRVAAVGIVIAVVLITLQIPGIADLVNSRTDTAISTGGAGRTDIWTVGLTIAAKAPATGVGIANFPLANTPELLRQQTLATGTAETLANLGPHNLVIGTLAELGLVGLSLLMVFLVPLVVRRGWGPDATLIQAALASLLVIAMFQDMLARKELWLLIGIAAGLAYLKKTTAQGLVIRPRPVPQAETRTALRGRPT